MFKRPRKKYDYLTDNWHLNEALNSIDSDLSSIRARVEEDFDILMERIEKLEHEVEKIKKKLGER